MELRHSFRWSEEIPNEVEMIYFDSNIKTRLGQPADEPLDRRFYTKLLKRLTTDGAKLVLFDVLFDSPNPDVAVDAEFADAIRQHGRVALVGYMVNQFQGSIATTMPMPPTPVLAEAAAGWGLAEVSPDPEDKCVRLLDPGSENYPSASWAAASILSVPITKHPERRREERWLNYYCAPTLLRAVNLDQALEPGLLPPGYFRGKIVIVGTRPRSGGIANAEREEFKSPFTRYETASGPSIHAMSLLNLYRGDWLTRPILARESILVFGWGILISFILLQLRPWQATLAAPAIFCLFALLAIGVQIRYHVWFSWLVPAAAQTSVALIWSVGFQYLIESRRRRMLRRAFSAYLSPYMADQIAESEIDISLGGKEVEATILFTDLEGFTNLSESLPPAEVSHILTSYFNETTRAILEQEGTIIKYIGDAVMAAWNAPMPEPRHAERAVLAAWGMLQAGRKRIAGRTLRTRIGINTGKVLAGNLGSKFRFDYTAIGDTTNTASRLEGLNKFFATDLLIGDATKAQLTNRIHTRMLGHFLVAGKCQPLAVHEVLGVDLLPDGAFPWVTIFDAAVRHFTDRQLDEAERLFGQVIQLRGGQDGPAEFYLRQIATARAVEPSPDRPWDGVVVITSK